MEFEPPCTNSPSKLPANDVVMTSVNLLDNGREDADTMTPSADRGVDIHGRTLFTDLKESPPGATSGSPIILDNLTGATANNGLSPPLDGCNVSIPPSKDIQSGKVTPSLPKKKLTKEEKEQLKAQREKEKVEKERERVEREKDRAEKKAQKESEREAKKQEKEKELKEKRLKQEQREAEKKKKQEENQMKQEAKRRKEQEERERQDKRQQHFMSFFEKKSSPKGLAKESADVGQKDLFPPFPAMPGVTVAKLPSPLKDSTVFDEVLAQEVSCQSDFLERCRRTQTSRKRDHCPLFIKPAEYEASNDCVIVGGDSSEEAAGQSRKRLKYKLLQFKENHRPAYWGTWSKKSDKLNPRNPFTKDESLVNYEVDSDEEWEEEEQGESISSSEDEEEPAGVEGEDDEDDDGFFVPHGYLSEGEGDVSEQEMEVDVKEPSSVKNQFGKDADKAALWDLEASRIQQPLKPVCIGCIFEGEESQNPKQAESVQLLNQFRAILLTDGPIDPLQQTSANATQEVVGVTCKTPGSGGVGANRNLSIKQPVPEEAMPDLIRALHGSQLGVQRIIKEFRQFWGAKKASKSTTAPDGDNALTTKDAPSAADGKENVDYSAVCGISKRQLESKIQQIAKKESRPPDYRQRFYVHCDILEKYGIDPALPAMTVPVSVVSPFSRSSGNQNVLPLTPGVMQTPTRKRAAAVDVSPDGFGTKTATPCVPVGVSCSGCVGLSHGGYVGVSHGDPVGVAPSNVGVLSGGVSVSASAVEVSPIVDTAGISTTELVGVATESVAAKESGPVLPPEKRLKVEDKRLELLA